MGTISPRTLALAVTLSAAVADADTKAADVRTAAEVSDRHRRSDDPGRPCPRGGAGDALARGPLLEGPRVDRPGARAPAVLLEGQLGVDRG